MPQVHYVGFPSFPLVFPPKGNRINKTRSWRRGEEGREGRSGLLHARCDVTLQQVKIYGRRFILTPICRAAERGRLSSGGGVTRPKVFSIIKSLVRHVTCGSLHLHRCMHPFCSCSARLRSHDEGGGHFISSSVNNAFCSFTKSINQTDGNGRHVERSGFQEKMEKCLLKHTPFNPVSISMEIDHQPEFCSYL